MSRESSARNQCTPATVFVYVTFVCPYAHCHSFSVDTEPLDGRVFVRDFVNELVGSEYWMLICSARWIHSARRQKHDISSNLNLVRRFWAPSWILKFCGITDTAGTEDNDPLRTIYRQVQSERAREGETDRQREKRECVLWFHRVLRRRLSRSQTWWLCSLAIGD